MMMMMTLMVVLIGTSSDDNDDDDEDDDIVVDDGDDGDVNLGCVSLLKSKTRSKIRSLGFFVEKRNDVSKRGLFFLHFHFDGIREKE